MAAASAARWTAGTNGSAPAVGTTERLITGSLVADSASGGLSSAGEDGVAVSAEAGRGSGVDGALVVGNESDGGDEEMAHCIRHDRCRWYPAVEHMARGR